VYSVIKLRLPDDNLINALTDLAEAKIFEMNPKDLALVAWAIARSRIPDDSPIVKKIVS
jgi:hypothetical protein